MEAIQSLGIDWRLLVAQIVNFVVLLILLRKFLYTPVLNMLESRKVKIEKSLKDSEEADQKVAQCEADCKKLSQGAVKESETIVTSAKKLAESEAKKIVAEAEKKSQRIIALAEEEAKTKKENALLGAKKDLVDLVVLSTEKILGKSVDKASVSETIGRL